MGGKGSGNKMAYKNLKGNSPVIGDNGLSINDSPGLMAEITRQALTVGFLWDVIDKKDPVQLQQRAIEYFNYCIDNDSKPGNMGLYSAWGIDRREISSILAREPSSPRSDVIKKSQQILSDIREKLMLDGKVNPITGIFWQKNYDGLKDQQDIVVGPRNQIESDQTPEDVHRLLEDSIPIDVEATDVD